MALIDCPECSRRVSDQADSCPSCGWPVDKAKDGTSAERAEGRAEPPVAPSAAAAATPAGWTTRTGLLVAGGAAALATFLPWVTFDYVHELSGFSERNGYMGVLSLAAATVLILAGIGGALGLRAIGLACGALFLLGLPWPAGPDSVAEYEAGTWIMLAASAAGAFFLARLDAERDPGRASVRIKIGGAALAGGLAAIVGGATPWITAGDRSLGGLSDIFAAAGVVPIAAGSVIVLAALTGSVRPRWLIPALAGIIAASAWTVIAGVEFATIDGERLSDYVNVGVGAYLMLGGAGAVVFGFDPSRLTRPGN